MIKTHLAGIVYVKGTHARSPKHSIKPNPSVVTSMVERIALGSGFRVQGTGLRVEGSGSRAKG